jgi:hypothetical protein
LNVTHDGNLLYNIIYTKVSEANNQRAPRSSKLRLKSTGECDQVILCHLPGISLVFNDITKELKIILREVSSYDSEVYFEDIAKDTVFNEYIIAPGIKYGMVDPSDNILDPSDNLVNMDIFLNIELTRDFFDEIVYYKDLISNDFDHDLNTFGNQIYYLESHLNNLIIKMENIHKYVVQQAKINEFSNAPK